MGERWKHWLLPWYNHQAQQIKDPVKRLRYLRSVGVNPDQMRKTPRVPLDRAAAALLLVIAASLLFFRIGGSSARAVGKQPPRTQSSARPSRQYVLEPLTASEKKVWVVEKRPGGEEVYSNGLRIETARTAANSPRTDRTISVDGLPFVTGAAKPAGIVFHTTESHIAAFDADNNLKLQRVGRWLVDYVAQNHFYHYLIDRFGRVHRVVPEDDVAHHAGRSVWADRKNTYVDLNGSFLAISLESETQRGVLISDSVTPAQIHALRTLTVMLRLKYNIDEANCVTHAQVSVNPDNFRIGAHTDWASNFPFGEVGLPDNYLRTSPAMLAFGFQYDDDYKLATGARMWKGLEATDLRFAAEAASAGRPLPEHRNQLKRRYRAALDAIKAASSAAAAAASSASAAAEEPAAPTEGSGLSPDRGQDSATSTNNEPSGRSARKRRR